MARKKPGAPTAPPVTWAQATRDIVLAAMNNGQLLPLGLTAVVLLLIWRMPSEQAGALAREVLNGLRHAAGVAYVALIGVSVGWVSHVRWMRLAFRAEYERIGREKSELQRLVTGADLKSSEDL